MNNKKLNIINQPTLSHKVFLQAEDYPRLVTSVMIMTVSSSVETCRTKQHNPPGLAWLLTGQEKEKTEESEKFH